MNAGQVIPGDAKQADSRQPWVNDERWALALRIVASRQLVKAAQLREILLYLSQRVLTDSNAAIREYEIGCGVLGRRSDFNPNDDNIVRVQISHLRKKLDEYFSAEGAAEPLILTIPRGSYVPRFTPRLQPVLDAEPSEPIAANVPVTPAEKVRRASPWWVWRAGVAVAIIFITTGIFAFYRRQMVPPRNPPAMVKASSLAQNFIWADIFDPTSPPIIVVADTCLVMLQDTLDTDISLADYISGHYPDNLLARVHDPAMRRTLTTLAGRQYTSLGDVHISSGLIELGRLLGASGSIRYARHLNIRDFQTGNFVLIGSRRGNPWVGLFEQQLNFKISENPADHTFYFHNRTPRPGEPSDYLPAHNGSNISENYADIALVPNLGKDGYVLILNGVTMESTEAAGQLLIQPDFSQLLSKVVKAVNTPIKTVEILIRVRSFGGAASNSEIVASRVRS
jgi:hypothetical protein